MTKTTMLHFIWLLNTTTPVDDIVSFSAKIFRKTQKAISYEINETHQRRVS